MVALTVRNPTNLPLYITMAAAGSTLGCYFLDLTVRKGGGAGLEMVLSPKRLVRGRESRTSRCVGPPGRHPVTAALSVYSGGCRRVRSALSARQDAQGHRDGARGPVHHHRIAGHLAGAPHVEGYPDARVRVVHGRLHWC